MHASGRDLSHAEIAERMPVPPGSAKPWIRRGLRKLRHCLEQGKCTGTPDRA
ncbi:sigma factor-like helix-turn-helix DNA-binding protein [Pseudoduganella sp. SL102]|uniref:sigma factor-like helix-turn-helix DNA-binding protein n=1 Tax=Pseudoduganella sp. SL102 TaxID=2995154 RepID=UPI00248AFC0A|nr:sigma factor-like helix-turn-helix DNA-binding protein [Pseudoduganella sp. SL102]WBS05122.1 sigma factor-like helix-turn-helix DNA-binding protein [Pseudoduganella sp. SL102]